MNSAMNTENILIGTIVEATRDVQSLIAGERYRVAAIATRSSFAGVETTLWLKPVDRTMHCPVGGFAVRNPHIVLREVP